MVSLSALATQVRGGLAGLPGRPDVARWSASARAALARARLGPTSALAAIAIVVRRIASASAESGPAARRGRRWLMFMLIGTSSSLSLIACIVFDRASGPAAATAVPRIVSPANTLDHLRVVCDELNLETRTLGGRVVVYSAGRAATQTALALARESPAAIRPQIVSMPDLQNAVRHVFTAFGFVATDEAVDGLDISLNVRVPDALEPLNQAVVGAIRASLLKVSALSQIHINEDVVEEQEPFLLATLVGDHQARAFTADGPHVVGDTVLDHFTIRSITPEGIVISGVAGTASVNVDMVVPLRGQVTLDNLSARTLGIPSLRSALLN